MLTGTVSHYGRELIGNMGIYSLYTYSLPIVNKVSLGYSLTSAQA